MARNNTTWHSKTEGCEGRMTGVAVEPGPQQVVDWWLVAEAAVVEVL